MLRIALLLLPFLITLQLLDAQTLDAIAIESITFKSEDVILSGTLYKPKQIYAGVVIVHGSGKELRMSIFAELLAKKGIAVLTYDKRGVGESGGVYVGPEVGTNNIDSLNLSLLAKDANAAANILKQRNKNIPIGFIGFSQAGWIIPLAVKENPSADFMVMFSCPTVTTLEQLRFQFYTNGSPDFWDTHTQSDAYQHIKNDPDRYQFTDTDPKIALRKITTPGLWLFGEKDIQVPVKLCIEQINALKVQGKPFDYVLFPKLGHSTAFSNDSAPVDIAVHWIQQRLSALKGR